MELSDNLKKATALKKELDNLRPLSPGQEKRIMQKFRLDWNYHSSRIEGNSLTYGETKALILFNHTAQSKPLKDHMEMSGHDEAIKNIEEIIKQKRPLTETFIRELHKIILKQPYEVDALTPEGKPIKKWVKIGMYKTTPNHVKTLTGEMFYFASPEETPAKMGDLMKWFTVESEKDEMHRVIFATEFHYRFIRIHPFDDGNGRIARLLMNFVLMQKGYPPAIIKEESRDSYYEALEQADAGQLDYFFNFICEQVIYSLELMLRGARGGDIEESGDLDKKLQLLKMRLGKDPHSKIAVKRNHESIKNVIEKSILPFVNALEKKITDFDSFFRSRNVLVEFGRINSTGKNLYTTFKNLAEQIFKKSYPYKKIMPVKLELTFRDLLASQKPLPVKGPVISIEFYENVYEIKGNGIRTVITKLYDEFFTKEEIEEIVNQIGNWQYDKVDGIIKKIGY
jgi:Fic family protein